MTGVQTCALPICRVNGTAMVSVHACSTCARLGVNPNPVRVNAMSQKSARSIQIGQHQVQMVTHRLNRAVTQERHAEHQPHRAVCGELPATNRSGSCRCKGLRHQCSVKAIGEGVEVVEWLIAGRGQQCGAKVHPSS